MKFTKIISNIKSQAAAATTESPAAAATDATTITSLVNEASNIQKFCEFFPLSFFFFFTLKRAKKCIIPWTRCVLVKI